MKYSYRMCHLSKEEGLTLTEENMSTDPSAMTFLSVLQLS